MSMRSMCDWEIYKSVHETTKEYDNMDRDKLWCPALTHICIVVGVSVLISFENVTIMFMNVVVATVRGPVNVSKNR